MNKTANTNNLTNRQGKGLIACSVLLRSFSEPLSIFVKTAEGTMHREYIVRQVSEKWLVIRRVTDNAGVLKDMRITDILQLAGVK